MSDALEDTTSEEITADYVRRRVDDWGQRIDDLYANVESWLPAGWRAERRRIVHMNEEMMRKFGVPGRDLPVLDLVHSGAPEAYIEPRGLWIIGANGRIDLIRRPRHYVIVDSAKGFRTPKWRIALLSERRNQKPFGKASLRSILT
jgi:hypothetical protein